MFSQQPTSPVFFITTCSALKKVLEPLNAYKKKIIVFTTEKTRFIHSRQIKKQSDKREKRLQPNQVKKSRNESKRTNKGRGNSKAKKRRHLHRHQMKKTIGFIKYKYPTFQFFAYYIFFHLAYLVLKHIFFLKKDVLSFSIEDSDITVIRLSSSSSNINHKYSL